MLLVGMSSAQDAKSVNNINGSMPNRISMNVTVAKQTQGATFGEKGNAGLHAAGSALNTEYRSPITNFPHLNE
jgi:hypothetical protein